MTRLGGRSLINARLAESPYGQRTTTTLMSAILANRWFGTLIMNGASTAGHLWLGFDSVHLSRFNLTMFHYGQLEPSQSERRC